MFLFPLNANLLTISSEHDHSRDPSAGREMTSDLGIQKANEAKKWSTETIEKFVILKAKDAEEYETQGLRIGGWTYDVRFYLTIPCRTME